MSPWMWNSGMTSRQRSSSVSPSDAAMLAADAERFAWVSGTSFGLDVVPEVCSRSATSPGWASRADRGTRAPAPLRPKIPAAWPPGAGPRSRTGIACARATCRATSPPAAGRITALGRRSPR